MAEVCLIEDGAVLVEDDKILRVGSTRQLENLKEARDAHVIEAHGKVVMPGFIDSSTRLVSGAPLWDEMEAASGWQGPWRLPDGTKADRLGRCRSIRNASPNVLRNSAKRWLAMAAASGTTALEIRSAQGLHMHTEMKALRAVRALHVAPLDIQPVALVGPSDGDSFPAPEQAAKAVVDTLIPELVRRKLSRYLAVDTDPVVFGTDGLRRILAAARDLRLRPKFQMKVADIDTIRLAMETGAASVDHLMSAGREEIAALATSDLIATLLPAASLQHGGPFAPARDLIDAGGAVALASGFGAAGGPTINMATVMSLACSQMRLSPAEALIATTVNAAAAMGHSSTIGILEPGKQADLTIFDVADYREIPYYLGANLCALTMKKGRIIHSATTSSVGAVPRLPPRRADNAVGGPWVSEPALRRQRSQEKRFIPREPMDKWVECIPNISEGRDNAVLAAIRASIETTPDVYLLDDSADADHHRSVFTFVGPPAAITNAVLNLARVVIEFIDLRRHRGIHPRMGALDVVPLVPLEGVTIDECIDEAGRLGDRLWNECRIPVYFYGAAARQDDRRRLENVRRGRFEGLRAALPDDETRRPDIGGPFLHETAGATAVGVRPFLIAFNVNLATPDLKIAREIARRVRESSGGLPAVKALGLALGARGITQVSMNLVDFERTPPRAVFGAVQREAAALGVDILESELIGLIPRSALRPTDARDLMIRSFDDAMILENRLEAMKKG